MTPRALLTAIGATAIGFAVIIGSAATSGITTQRSPAAASVQTAGAGDGVQTMAHHLPASGLVDDGATGAGRSSVSWSEDCPPAL